MTKVPKNTSKFIVSDTDFIDTGNINTTNLLIDMHNLALEEA